MGGRGSAKGAQTHQCCETSLASSISTWPAPIDMVAPCGPVNKGVSVQRITGRLGGWHEGEPEGDEGAGIGRAQRWLRAGGTETTAPCHGDSLL